MKKLPILLIIAIAALAALATGAFFNRDTAPAAPPQHSARIVLTESGYEPPEVTLFLNGEVTFANETGKPHWPASNLHPTHDIYPEFDPLRPLDPGEEWSFTFDRVGTHNYHDHIRSYFRGVIHVVEQ